MQPFDPLTIPLAGRQLIEASAGTGKTYCLALLYLRLILERGLEAEQILVVTFTKAATEELRGRIRGRLRQALDLLEGSAVAGEGDLLPGLLAGLTDRDAAGQRLADTLTRMDEAAIYTIHGFCQRMLQDQAFEAGIPFGVEFIESEQLLRRQIVEDFWRQRFYAAPAEEAAWASDLWQDPAGLLQFLQGSLARSAVTFVPAVTAAETGRLRAEAEQLWHAVRADWLRDREEVRQILDHDPCLSRDKSKGYGGETPARILAAMDLLASRQGMAWLLPRDIELLADTEMACRLKGKKIQPSHSFFQLFAAWRQRLAAFLRAVRAYTVAEAHSFLLAELDRRKREQNVLYFNDQLARLAAALAGAGGRHLAQRIRGRFAAALVDEFQDTDPLQYSIFQTLFAEMPDPGLFMIGDPKQSIYSFRGADIFAYIRARRETASGAVHTMDSNYRSSPAMVMAVNRLFTRRPHFVFAEIEFHPVRSGRAGESSPLLVGGAVPAPLQVQMLPCILAAAGKARIAKDPAGAAAAAWTAREIARLLHLGRSGQASLEGRPLAGGDLAVLVRTHREADLMRRALSRLQIASVYYSQDSVFATAEAGQLAHLLAALLDLADEARVSNALVTDLFGLDALALHALRRDPLRWGETVAELAEYHQHWERAGVLAMLHLLLQRRQAVRRLLARNGGERMLTNFLHLAELLQEAAERLGPDELLRWFNQQRGMPEPEAAGQQLRLESDADLVRIVTVHKAKGLEYPLVFLPFLWSARPVRADGIFPFHGPGADGTGARLQVDVGSGEAEHYRQAERERLAEDLRLLYVAMTRAKYCAWFCWGPILGMEQSALAWLLHPAGDEGVAQGMSTEEIRAGVADLDNGEGILHFVPWSEEEGPADANAPFRPPLPGPREFSGHIDASWTMASYSRLAAKGGPLPGLVEAGDASAAPGSEGARSPFTFPRGAAAGTFLHAVLEQLDFQNPGGMGVATVADLLRRGGLAGQWAPMVLDWLAQVVATPLREEGDLRLGLVRREDRLVELGFHFALDDLAQDALNRLLQAHAVPPVEMQSPRLHGLMKGYVDLVFRHHGRFYIVDYKSNYLGATADHYRREEMGRAMAEHRYDLQYLIYTVALHRYLRQRLQDYDYRRHFGGVYYLFLRGMRPELGPGSGVWHALPPLPLVEGLDRCCGSGGGH